MDKKVKHVLVSSDENSKYISFWPTIAYMWSNMGYIVHLFILTNKNINDPFIKQLQLYGDVVPIKICEHGSHIIQSKLLRFYATKYFYNDVVCVQDIDYYIFDNNDHVEKYIDMENLTNEKIYTFGFDMYTYGHDAYWLNPIYKFGIRRFPASPTVGMGKCVYSLFCDNMDYSFDEFILHIKTNYDTIINSIHTMNNNTTDINDEHNNMKHAICNYMSYYNMFDITSSDETIILILSLLNANTHHKKIIYVNKIDYDINTNICHRRIYNKDGDYKKYKNVDLSKYIDIQPYKQYSKTKFKQFLDYLNIPEDIQNVNIEI